MVVAESVTSEFAVKLGERIRLFRKRRGLKQKTLADMLGYKSHATIGFMETGAQVPSLEATIAIARALDVSVLDLLGELVFDDTQKEYYEPWMVTLREQILLAPHEYCATIADMLETIVLGLRAKVAQV